MIKKILIIECEGIKSTYDKAAEEAKLLCSETKEDVMVVPAQGLVVGRNDKYYEIYALCYKKNIEHCLEKIDKFINDFKIDYQYKLIGRQIPTFKYVMSSYDNFLAERYQEEDEFWQDCFNDLQADLLIEQNRYL